MKSIFDFKNDFFGRLCWVTSNLNQFLNFGFEFPIAYTVDCVRKFSCVVKSTSVKILDWKLVDKIWLSILSHFSPWHQRTLKMHIFSPSIFWGIPCFTLLHYSSLAGLNIDPIFSTIPKEKLLSERYFQK